MQFRNREVHTINTRNERRRHENHCRNREDLYNLVLLDIDQTQSRILDIVQSLKTEIGMVDQRIHILDHQLQPRIDIIRESYASQNTRQHSLTVKNILSQQHRTLLQPVDTAENLLVDRILTVHVAAERRYLTGNKLDHVGIIVDSHLQQGDEDMITGRIVAVVDL